MPHAVQGPYPQKEDMSPLTITAIHLLVGGLWILFSDVLLHALVSDSALLLKLQTFKGWFYVAATGLMLYVLIGRSTRMVRKVNEALRHNDEDLRTILNTTRPSLRHGRRRPAATL